MIFEKNPEIGDDEDPEAVAEGASTSNGAGAMIAGCIIGSGVGGAAGIGIIGLGAAIATAA